MFNLLPKDTVFYDLFENIATRIVASAQHLHRLRAISRRSTGTSS